MSKKTPTDSAAEPQDEQERAAEHHELLFRELLLLGLAALGRLGAFHSPDNLIRHVRRRCRRCCCRCHVRLLSLPCTSSARNTGAVGGGR
jgi:hypothetical protein